MMSLGEAKVHISDGRGMSPEEIADFAIERIMNISNGAPQPIRDQAYTFKNQIRLVLVEYLKQAARSERVTICNLLRESGQEQLADKIWRA